MPFKSVEDAVKKHPGLGKYSQKAQRGWLGAINDCFAGGGNDAKCFPIAWSVANKIDKKKAGMLERVAYDYIANRVLSRYNAPPRGTNWDAFAKFFDIGTVDLDAFADDMGFDDFKNLDLSITPRELFRRNKRKFLVALKEISMKAEDMDDSELSKAIPTLR